MCCTRERYHAREGEIEMVTQYEAIIEAFRALGGEKKIREIEEWVSRKYGRRWKDFGTPMADTVPRSLGGNKSSQCPRRYQVLKRVARGVYRLIDTYSTESTDTLKRENRQHEKRKKEKQIGERVGKTESSWKLWISGHPAPFATRGEKTWKNTLNRAVPECHSNLDERGLTLDFKLVELAPQGQPLDVDNLCEPVFSVLINRKGWFNGRRPNLYWYQATKVQNQESGCSLQIHLNQKPPTTVKDPIFYGYYPGPLPRSARDPELPAWIRKKANQNHHQLKFIIHLKFDNTKINIGDIATGVVKSTIDCLYPIIGGEAGAPRDDRISILQVEKSHSWSKRNGVHIIIGAK